MRILLVEDDASFREVFTRALGKALASEYLDVSFVEADTLAGARARLKEGGLDAALIDVTMPDGDGLELVGDPRRWRRQPDPEHGVDGEPGDLCGGSGDRAGSKRCALQVGFDARDRGRDQDTDQR